MPFKSEAQRRKFHAMESRGELPKGTAERWEKETPKGAKLPERIGPKKKTKPAEAYEEGVKKALEVYAVPKPPPTWAHGTAAKHVKLPSMSERPIER